MVIDERSPSGSSNSPLKPVSIVACHSWPEMGIDMKGTPSALTLPAITVVPLCGHKNPVQREERTVESGFPPFPDAKRYLWLKSQTRPGRSPDRFQRLLRAVRLYRFLADIE